MLTNELPVIELLVCPFIYTNVEVVAPSGCGGLDDAAGR